MDFPSFSKSSSEITNPKKSATPSNCLDAESYQHFQTEQSSLESGNILMLCKTFCIRSLFLIFFISYSCGLIVINDNNYLFWDWAFIRLFISENLCISVVRLATAAL